MSASLKFIFLNWRWHFSLSMWEDYFYQYWQPIIKIPVMIHWYLGWHCIWKLFFILPNHFEYLIQLMAINIISFCSVTVNTWPLPQVGRCLLMLKILYHQIYCYFFLNFLWLFNINRSYYIICIGVLYFCTDIRTLLRATLLFSCTV